MALLLASDGEREDPFMVDPTALREGKPRVVQGATKSNRVRLIERRFRFTEGGVEGQNARRKIRCDILIS